MEKYCALVLAIMMLSCAVLAGDIHDAVMNGDIDLVQDLIAADTSLVDTANSQGMTPLRLALHTGNIEIARLLLDRGAGTDDMHPAYGNVINQAFIGACQKGGGPELVELLMDHGVSFDANQIDALGMSPLDWAVHFGNLAMAQLVLRHGGDVNVVSRRLGRSPLVAAASKGSDELVDVLLEQGADVSIADQQGNPPVYYAVVQGRTSILKSLLAHGASAALTEPHYGRSLLHLAAINGYRDIAETLVNHGANIDAVDKSGRTPLYYAARYGNINISNYLTGHGAAGHEDLNENYGTTPPPTKVIGEGRAVIRYLNHRGWAVTTDNHVLVFDAEEFGVRRPDNPGFANGFLTAGELEHRNVVAAYSCYHGQPGEPAYIHTLADSLEDISYIHLEDDAWRGSPNTTYLKGGSDTLVAGLKIQSIDIADYMPMLAYMCHADGLTIYYQAFGADDPDSLLHRYEFLAQVTDTVDIAFLPIPEADQERPDVRIFLERFPTRSVVLLDSNRREYMFPDAARDIDGWGFSTRVLCAENPGDRFDY